MFDRAQRSGTLANNFEAGALSNHPSNPHVRTVLFDLKHSDVVGPLADFQHTILNDQNDVLKLVRDIAAVSEPANIQPVVPTLFEKFWPELDDKLASIRQESQNLPTDEDSALPRSPEELIEEVLERVQGSRHTAKSAVEAIFQVRQFDQAFPGFRVCGRRIYRCTGHGRWQNHIHRR